MQFPDPSFEAGEDAELRAVPLPEGLLQRLRRTALADDEGLDATVREVPVPAGLLGRLRRTVLSDDEGLDAAIGCVPIPVGLVRRLQRSVLSDDEGLDAALRDVPVPVDLWGRLQRLPKHRTRLMRLTQWATAASLVIGIGLSYVGAVVAFLLATLPASDMSRPELVASWEVGFPSRPGEAVDFVAGRNLLDAEKPDESMVAGLRAPVPGVDLVELDEPSPAPLMEVSSLFGSSHATPLLAANRWGVFATHSRFDELPEVKPVARLTRRGIGLPLVRGSNYIFLIKHRVRPFVSPAAHPRLQTSLVPLDVDTSSYELTRRDLEEGELPLPEDVRTEEFLAAVDYEFPPPKRRALELCTAAGPSPFGGDGFCVLQIGVQARHFRDQRRRPAHLILAVDVSASMRWGGRLETIRRALSSVASQLGPEDRISLVSFSEEAELLVEDCGRDDAEDLRAAVDWLSVESSTNVGVGLRQAYAVAPHLALSDKTATRVVLLTDGRTELGRGAAERIERRLVDAARRGVLLEVIDLGQDEAPDQQLASFARSGGGKVHRATNADQVRWALLEIITGRSQLVAADARLEVTFNPKTVWQYRLLGHEAEGVAGLMPAQPEADFHAGQSATALYEIQLKPGGSSGGNDVATVELTWRDPGGGEAHGLNRKVRRNQFASSFVQAPLSLQEAVLVAQTAEVLRKSWFARVPPKVPPNSRSLALVLELAGRVDTRLYQRPTFVEFMSLVEQAEGAK